MFEDIDINALGQAIDTTFGRSSTPKMATFSVKFKISGQVLCASYASIVNFASEKQMIETKRAYATEADAVVKSAIKKVKADYKSISGKNLTLEHISDQDSVSVEIINMNVHSAKRTAYFRKKTCYLIK